MTNFNDESFSQATNAEKTLINKLESLSMEDDKKERRRLSSELFEKVTEMIDENQEMKKELFKFMVRMKGN